MSWRLEETCCQSDSSERILANAKSKAVEHEGNGDNNCSWHAWNGPQKHEKKIGGIRNHKNLAHLVYSIVKIGKNSEKSP